MKTQKNINFIIFTLSICLLELSPNTALAKNTQQIPIPAGPFIMGSDNSEREHGYQLDEARNSSASRRYRWFENETRVLKTLPEYFIDRNLVSNADYAAFIEATGQPTPYVDRETWQNYKLVHPYNTAQKYI